MPTRISDAALTQKAKRAKKYEEQIADLVTKKATLEGQIIREMERRNTRQLENNGVRIVKVQQERTVIDETGLLADLRPRQRKLCQKTVFDRQGLQAAVQANLIDVQVVSDHSEVKPNKPYVVITLGVT